MDLEQLRKRAKEIVKARRGTEHPVKLADAQFQLARELGFPSWPLLKAYVARADVQQPFRQDLGYYAERAYGLLASAQDGTPSAVAEFTSAGQPLTRAGARAVVAARHGFTGWQALARHLRGLDTDPFARAFRLIEARDVDGLTTHLDRFPDLVARRGTNGNDLLGLAASTHDERLVRVLLDHGADPDAANAHGWTALHQAGYANLPWLARLLLDAGARTDTYGRGDGGTPLIAALFWGNREVARVLADRSTAPDNLRVFAGLDRAADVERLTTPTLDPRAGQHRGFYRPHSGFPRWQPSPERQEILDEALTWAARNAAVAAMDRLVRAGADVDADPYRGTALTWAAWRGQDDAVRWLLEAGATVDRRGTFGGPGHAQGVTALHLTAENGHATTASILLGAGADPTMRDALHGGDAAGWAEHGGHPELAAELRRAR